MSNGKYDRSLTDLMAGAAVVFLLMAVIFIRKSEAERQVKVEKGEKVENQQEQVEASLVKLKTALEQLNEQIGGRFLQVSQQGNTLEIQFSDLKFKLGKCETPPEYATLLRDSAVKIVGTVCSALEEMRRVGAFPSIVLEGHTDDRPFSIHSSECGVGRPNYKDGFEDNVRASAARAQSVFFTLREGLASDPEERNCLDKHFVVSGRGQAAPVDPEHPDRNRRTIIRVRGDLRL
jgi:flagellar motor protein MotB